MLNADAAIAGLHPNLEAGWAGRTDGAGRYHCRAPLSRRRPPEPHGPVYSAAEFLLCVFLLVVLLPVLGLIVVSIWMVDRGPAIFPHRRVGQDGRPFHCLKFRTMYVGAEQRLQAVLAADPGLRSQWEREQKLAPDPRITPFGAFLRQTSLDELPQLVNVLRGEMSLVGPRPIVEDEVVRYGRFIHSYYSVRPGLTGLWQVTGRSATTYRRRVATDVVYARTKSVSVDLKIIVMTIPAVLKGQGAC